MKLRACLSCYHRKIKCDRKQPCINCVDANELCTFPQGKIRRNRPGRKELETPLTQKRDAILHVKSAGQQTPTSSSDTGEEDEYMVVDSTSQSRLLAGNAWANVKEEVRIFLPFQVSLLNLYSRKEVSKILFSTCPPKMCRC